MLDNVIRMSEKAYRQSPELNSSTLKMCLTDKRMYIADKFGILEYDNVSMQVGRALHVRYLLGKKEFFDNYWEKKFKKGSKKYEEETVVSGGKEMLSTIIFEKVLKMGNIAEASMAIPKKALKEVSFFSRIDYIKFKCRADAILENDDGTLTI